MQKNNCKADTQCKTQITKMTTKNTTIFNKNDDPFANNCQLSPGLYFLINKVL